MAEILAQRVGDRVLVPDEQADGAVEPFDALLRARRTVLEMRILLTSQHILSCGRQSQDPLQLAPIAKLLSFSIVRLQSAILLI